MRKKNRAFVLMAAAVLIMVQLRAGASELSSEEAATESVAEISSAATEAVSEIAETNTSQNTEEPISEDITTADSSSENTMPPLKPGTNEIATEAKKEEEKDPESLFNLIKDKNTEAKGLVYYCNAYVHDQVAEYLKVYKEYIIDVVQAYASLYEVGEITEIEKKECELQKNMVDAQIEVAENNAEYYRGYLKQNSLDYSSYKIKDIKEIHDVDYYVNRNKELDYMTVAEYVKEYKNALAFMDAAKAEIEVNELKLKVTKALYETGEIPKIELSKQKAAVAKARYELEQYCVKMNEAYISLKAYCGEPLQ